MRKSSKLLALGIAAIAAVSVAGLTACGNEDAKEPDSTPKQEQTGDNNKADEGYKTPTRDYTEWQDYSQDQYLAEDVSAKKMVYQFTSPVELEGENSLIFVNLYEDGFLTALQMRGSAAFKYYGYWANMEDNLFAEVTCYRMFGSTDMYAIDYSYSLTMNNGTFDEFEWNASLGLADGGQYVRAAGVSGTGEVVYATEEECIQYANKTLGVTVSDNPGSSDPSDNEQGGSENNTEGEVLLSWTEKDGKPYTLECYKDGTNQFGYESVGLKETGTWAWSNWTFTLTNQNGTVITAQMDEAYVLSLDFTAVSSDQLTATFTCDSGAWGAALGQTGSYTPAQ